MRLYKKDHDSQSRDLFALIMVLRIFDEGLVGFFGHSLIFYDGGVKLTAVFHRPLLCLIVYVDDAEASALALLPFKIVGKAPMVVTHDVVFTLTDQLELIVDKSRTEAVAVVAGSVFCDVNGGLIFLIQALGQLKEPLVVDLPAHVVFLTIISHAVCKALDRTSGIIVDADKIVKFSLFDTLSAKYGEAALAAHHCGGDCPLEQVVGQARG